MEARLIPDPDLALAEVDPLDVLADPARPGANLPTVTRMTNPALERALRAAIAAIDAAALTERAARRSRPPIRPRLPHPATPWPASEIEAAQEAVAAVLNDLDAAVATAKAAGDTRTPDQIRTDTAIHRLTRGSHGTPDEPTEDQTEDQTDDQTDEPTEDQIHERADGHEPRPDAFDLPAAFDRDAAGCPRCREPTAQPNPTVAVLPHRPGRAWPSR